MEKALIIATVIGIMLAVLALFVGTMALASGMIQTGLALFLGGFFMALATATAFNLAK